MTISLALYKKIRDNKEFIIKNFYYNYTIGFIEHQYKNFVKKLEKNNRQIISIINEDSKQNSLNDNLFKNIIVIFDKLNFKNMDILICYTSKIQLDNMNSIKRDKLLDDYNEIYKDIPNNLDILKNKKDKIESEFSKLLIDIAKEDFTDCNALDTCYIPLHKFIKKLKNRDMTYGKYLKDEGWYFVIYNDVIYYITPTKDRKYIKLCINNTFTNDEAKWFIEFSETEYSPIFDSMKNSKNLPEPTATNELLKRRKSITELSKINYGKEPKNLGKYTANKYFDKNNINKKHLEYEINEVMNCFRNETNLPPVKANYRREPFLKQVLNFPHIFDNKTSNKGGKIKKCNLELVKKIRFELNNILDLIKIKYPPKKDKEYFLIDLAGGAGKHFDYSLYSFTEDELNEPQDKFLVKKNLWKKLEFKSNGIAKNICGLSNYLQKAPKELFDTVNKTFGKEFIKFTQNIILHKKWLRAHINNDEYFTSAIENILQGQKDKIYIIWNVKEQKIYLDNFLDDELKINRVDDKPQIYLDEEFLTKGKIRIIIETGESEQWLDYERYKSKKDEDYQEDKKLKSGSFKFNIKRNETVFFNDKKFQNKLDELHIDNSNYF